MDHYWLVSIAFLLLNFSSAVQIHRASPPQRFVQTSFSFPNPLLRMTTDNDVKMLKQDSNTPPDDTDPGSDVYVDADENRFLEKRLKHDDVLIPCSECMKLVHRYIGACAMYEASSKPLMTIRDFCEKSLGNDPTFNDRDIEYCHNLGHKLAGVTGANYAALHTNNHALGLCATYQQMCQTHGGPPNCYSGFCDETIQCIDCPFAVLQINEEAPMQAEVCGDRGECRLGSLKSRVGYCECDKGFRGLACDGYKIIPLKA